MTIVAKADERLSPSCRATRYGRSDVSGSRRQQAQRGKPDDRGAEHRPEPRRTDRRQQIPPAHRPRPVRGRHHEERHHEQVQPRLLDLVPHIGKVGVAQEPHEQPHGQQRDERGSAIHGRATGETRFALRPHNISGPPAPTAGPLAYGCGDRPRAAKIPPFRPRPPCRLPLRSSIHASTASVPIATARFATSSTSATGCCWSPPTASRRSTTCSVPASRTRARC